MNLHQHMGVIIGMATSLLVTPTVAQHGGGHGAHPLMPDQKLMVEYKLMNSENLATKHVEIKLSNQGLPAVISQDIELPWLAGALELTNYLPLAKIDQTVVHTDGVGNPAIYLSIDGPSQSYQRWLIAGDMERNRLVSFIGTWRFMAVGNPSARDLLWEQFRTEYSKAPSLHISSPDGLQRETVSVNKGSKKQLPALGVTIKVEAFYPHFAMDKDATEPKNESEKRINPAVLVRITAGDRQEKRWVFSKFPDYISEATDRLPIKIRLDCPVQAKSQAPDYVIVMSGNNRHELWSRYMKKVEHQALKKDETVVIAGSNYRFHFSHALANGKLVEQYVSSDKSGAVPAICFSPKLLIDLSSPLWIALNERRVVNTKAGPMAITFMTSSAQPQMGGHH